MTEDDTFDSLKQRVVRNEEGTFYFNDDNELHRDNDLPAIELNDGRLVWYQHGVPHRPNGNPAVMYPDGGAEYWVNGEFIGFKLLFFPFIKACLRDFKRFIFND